MTYIRFEPRRRFHAVYIDLAGVIYATVCGRLLMATNILDRSDAPPALCNCCRSRLARPYLLPANLQNAKETLNSAHIQPSL